MPIKVETAEKDQVKVEIVQYDYDKDAVDGLIPGFADLSQKDCLTVHTLFRGTAMYFEHVVSGPEYTYEVLEQFGKTRDSYGWKPETYKNLTDVVEKYLKDQGFTDSSWKFEDYKLELIESFNTVAKAAELAYLQKENET